MLEREQELDRLESLVDAAASGAGGAALIEGEAGIGKTSLLDAACERAAATGMTVLRARGGELEREFPWGVARQLLESVLPPAGEELLDETARLALPALGRGSGEGEDSSFAALHGLYWLTVSLCQRRPLVLAVDDVHWADRPSVRFVAYLAPRLGGLPILLLAATRPAGTEPGAEAEVLTRLAADPALPAIRPAALSASGSAALVRARIPAARADLCSACHELSAGNPFLLSELVAELVGEGADGEEALAHVRRITPGAVSRSVLLRLARLSPESVSLARAVAVLGTSTEQRHAAALSDLDSPAAAEAAGQLVRAGILAGETTLSFVHPAGPLRRLRGPAWAATGRVAPARGASARR